MIMGSVVFVAIFSTLLPFTIFVCAKASNAKRELKQQAKNKDVQRTLVLRDQNKNSSKAKRSRNGLQADLTASGASSDSKDVKAAVRIDPSREQETQRLSEEHLKKNKKKFKEKESVIKRRMRAYSTPAEAMAAAGVPYEKITLVNEPIEPNSQQANKNSQQTQLMQPQPSGQKIKEKVVGSGSTRSSAPPASSVKSSPMSEIPDDQPKNFDRKKWAKENKIKTNKTQEELTDFNNLHKPKQTLSH